MRLTGVKDREFESLSLRHISAVFPNKYAICIFQKGVRKVYVGDNITLLFVAFSVYNRRFAPLLCLFLITAKKVPNYSS